MQIVIRIIINMGNIRQERLSEGSILNLNERLQDIKFMKQEIYQGIYGL